LTITRYTVKIYTSCFGGKTLSTEETTDILDPDELEDRLTFFAEQIGAAVQNVIEASGLEKVVASVGIQTEFWEAMKVSGAEEEVQGFSSLWAAPGYPHRDQEDTAEDDS
jgi:hypothetical protein